MSTCSPDLVPNLAHRPRRLRVDARMRRLVGETVITPRHLVQPLFVREGITAPRPIASLPGQVQHTLDSLPTAITAAAEAGVGGVMLFGIPAERDAVGSAAAASSGILQQAIRVAKTTVEQFKSTATVGKVGPVVMADTCLDEFTDHGHCGVLDAHGAVDNDASVTRYAQMAVAQARAGADVVSPSGMMDGQVAAIRTALDAAGFIDTAILAYSAKFASAFYGPFREAVDSQLVGDRRSYQIDPANGRAALRQAALDEAQGADLLLVKPAGLYLDVLSAVAARATVPVAAYQVSGEYAAIEAAAANGWLDRRAVIEESLTSIRRTGADLILTYWATEAAGWFA